MDCSQIKILFNRSDDSIKNLYYNKYSVLISIYHDHEFFFNKDCESQKILQCIDICYNTYNIYCMCTICTIIDY